MSRSNWCFKKPATAFLFACATIWLSDAAQAATFSTSAINNATVQPGGPRSGTNGKRFFNIEGSNNNTFASFGVIDFATTSFGTISDPVNSLALTLQQSNASFTNAGSLQFYLTTDTTTNIEPSTSPLNFNASNLPTGLGSQLNTKYLLGSGSFTGTSSTNGTVDTFTFTPTGAAQTYLTNEINSGGLIRLIVAPNDATVAATYSGYSNTSSAAPSLTIGTTTTVGGPNAVGVPEPSLTWLDALGCAALFGTGLTIKRQLKNS